MWKRVQVAPTPYLQPMSKAAIQTLQTLREEDLINQACLAEFQKGVSQAALMRKYGIGRDHLNKALHGKIRPGGTQYQMLKKCCILIQENKTWHKVLRTLY